ncbi:MAG: hypothetical protein JW821_00470 [Deltaproteobacteria bacterium]|nr:hypothetical protein [Deltaproteobacteria bacterium]
MLEEVPSPRQYPEETLRRWFSSTGTDLLQGGDHRFEGEAGLIDQEVSGFILEIILEYSGTISRGSER